MRCSRFVVLVLVLLVPAALAPAGADAGKPAKSCSGGSTVERSVQVRLYERGADEHVLVGCHLRSGRRTVLARWYNCGCSIGDEAAPQVWLAGRHVAVNQYSCSPIEPAPCSGSVRVIDLRSGKVRYRADTGGSVAGLIILPNGTVAYVTGQRLIRINPSGSTELDEGAGIDPGSLAANRTRLYWLRDGVPKTAPLR